MQFNSIVFLLFIFIFFLFWPIARNKQIPRWIYIIIASFIFYGWLNWKNILLLVLVGIISFLCGFLISSKSKYKKLFLILSIIGNVGILCIFKYLGFFTSNFSALSKQIGFNLSIPNIHLSLPVGISFYIFMSLTYVFDIYKNQLKPVKNPLHYFAYLSFFPHIICGPIVRAVNLLPQLYENKQATDEQTWEGLKLIAFGYFKKMVIADNLAIIVNLAFNTTDLPQSSLYWWIVTTFFAIQIYCDFAGYSDIARGLAKLIGYEYPVNFNRPYISKSLQEFWTRWHITLSTWLRDYIFFPLLQKRMTPLNAHISMWITLLVSGLWHGAAWTFILWGAVHALYFSVERLTNWPKKLSRKRFGKQLSIVIVIILVWLAWVFFRSNSIGQAFQILAVMLNPFKFAQPFHPIPGFNSIRVLILVFILIWEFAYLLKLQNKLTALRFYPLLEASSVGFAITAAVFFRGISQTFIYFRF